VNPWHDAGVTVADLAAIVGHNARTLRGSATLDDVAKAARGVGLNWTTGRVSDLEYGRVSPTLPTLVAVALALAEVRGESITLADLVRSDENISLTKDLTVTGDELQRFLSGDKVSVDDRYLAEIIDGAKGALTEARKRLPPNLQRRRVSMGIVRQVHRDYGEPESLLARDLGLDSETLIWAMAALWRMSYSAKRDQRAGTGANAQKKGRVARELKAEMRAALDGES
jgi:hypothetical protein